MVILILAFLAVSWDAKHSTIPGVSKMCIVFGRWPITNSYKYNTFFAISYQFIVYKFDKTLSFTIGGETCLIDYLIYLI